MTIDQLRQNLLTELHRAEADAEMSANEDDLAYHNGEIDGLNYALNLIDPNLEVI